MNFLIKYRLRIGVVVVIIAIASVTLGWFPHKTPSKTSSTGTNTSQPTSSNAVQAPDPATKSTIDVDTFTYDKPAGWAAIAASALQTSGSITGIGLSSLPSVTFTAKVVDSVPANDSALKNDTLAGLKKFDDFTLISNTNIKVNGQSGQQFIYSFSGTSGKSNQRLIEIVYKQKTYMLLFQSLASDFDKQAGDFAKILDSFKFK